MTGEEYRARMDLVVAACRVLLMVDVDELLTVVERAEVLGPVMEPTMYQHGGARKLNEQREILQAAKRLRQVAEHYQPQP